MSTTTHRAALGAVLFAIDASPAVAPLSRLRGQQVLRDLLLAERHELESKPLTPRRREEIAACDRLLERLARLLESLH
jgi:hypothetical protein